MVGAGTIVTFFSVQAYLIDTFTLYAASGVISTSLISRFCMLTHFMITTALAAATFMRSLAGFGFPLFAPTMYNALGYGKGNTILAAAAIALGCPAYVNAVFYIIVYPIISMLRPWLFWFYGERIRSASRFARKGN